MTPVDAWPCPAGSCFILPYTCRRAVAVSAGSHMAQGTDDVLLRQSHLRALSPCSYQNFCSTQEEPRSAEAWRTTKGHFAAGRVLLAMIQKAGLTVP